MIADPEGLARARLVLVRHGESECNLRQVVGGPRGCTGLSAKGVVEVEALRDRIQRTRELSQTVALYSSVLPRAIQTAEILAPALGDLAVQSDCELCELHPGAADGLTWEEQEAIHGPSDFSVDPDRPISPGGESWSGFLVRVGRCLDALAERHRGEMAVVACHAGVIDASLIRLLGLSARGGRLDFRTGYASLTEWSAAEGSWRLARYNDAAHLKGDIGAP